MRVNNPGKDNRAIYDVSLKMDYVTDAGTFTSISAYNQTKEILTGDSYDFLPADNSLYTRSTATTRTRASFSGRGLHPGVQFTSPSERRFRWIAGAQVFGTKRFISTGNMGHRQWRGSTLYRHADASRIPVAGRSAQPAVQLPVGHPEQQRLGGYSQTPPA